MFFKVHLRITIISEVRTGKDSNSITYMPIDSSWRIETKVSSMQNVSIKIESCQNSKLCNVLKI